VLDISDVVQMYFAEADGSKGAPLLVGADGYKYASGKE
jgi:hypothetical protein